MSQKESLYFIYLEDTYHTYRKNLTIPDEFEVVAITLEDAMKYKDCNNSLVVICDKNITFDNIDIAYHTKGLVLTKEFKLDKDNASLVEYLHEKIVPVFWDIKDLMIYIKRYSTLKQLKTYSEIIQFLFKIDCAKHFYNVGNLSGSIASKLGYDRSTSEMIKNAASMHDIGKIAIPHSFLNSPHRFNEVEKKFTSLHVSYGCNLLENIQLLDCDKSFIKLCKDIVFSHHERYDGSGYPIGLKDGTISLAAKIVAVTDVYDAIRYDRPYRSACDHEIAISFLKANTDKFSPEVINVLEDIIENNPKDTERRLN